MSEKSIVSHNFLDFLAPRSENWTTASLDDGSYFSESQSALTSSTGIYESWSSNNNGTIVDGESVDNSKYNYYDTTKINQSSSEHVAEMAVAVVSASINSTISALGSTFLPQASSPSFLTNENGLSDGSMHNLFFERSDLSHYANSSYGSSTTPFEAGATSVTAGDNGMIDEPHHGTTPLLKLASTVIPENFQKLSTDSRNCVIAYVILFCIGAPGNLFVFISVGREIWRRQLMRSRIKVLIWHLATADLLVTLVVIPIEVFWRLTIQWYGGDALCKLAQFFRAFGLYLSSMVIICISLDRFFAIVFPLKVIGGMKRVRNMLCVAWGSAILFAAPQILVFRVQRHPLYPSFLLCTNSDYFLSLSKEIMYNLLSLIVMYFAPLLVIIVTYAMVLYTIARKSREHHQDCRPRSGSNQLRRSDNASNIARARRKTLWLSMLIVTAFLISWSPYVWTTIWYMFDFETADKTVDPRVHEAFFVTAVSNSCVNPLLYGNYMKKYWRNLKNAACRSRTSSTSSSRIASSSRNHHAPYVHNLQPHSQRQTSTYRCANPNHHFNLSPRCQSSGNASDVTIVLKEFPTLQITRGLTPTTTTTTTTTTSTNSSRDKWFL